MSSAFDWSNLFGFIGAISIFTSAILAFALKFKRVETLMDIQASALCETNTKIDHLEGKVIDLIRVVDLIREAMSDPHSRHNTPPPFNLEPWKRGGK